MTKLLLRFFVKTDPASTAGHAAIGKLAGIVGIVCNIFLFLGKLIIGLLAGSVAVVADAVNNLSDAASSVITLLGFRLAQQPADEDHPYGHARYEYLSGLAVAVVVLVIGVELATDSVKKIFQPEAMEVSVVTVAILTASIAVKLWMRVFFRTLGKRIDSTTLLAAAMDSRNDVIASTAVLTGCLISRYFHVDVDGYMGMAVAVFILYSGWGIVRETISPLLGKQADRELVERIRQLVLSHEKVLGIHDMLIHDYGPGRCYASVHVELNAEEDPVSCHDLLDDIENDVLEQMNIQMVIHYDPVDVNDREWKEMQLLTDRVVRHVHPALSIHDLRISRVEETPKLVFDLAVPFRMECDQEELRRRICKAIAKKKPQYVTVIRFDRGT